MSLKLFEKYDKELTEFQEWIKSKPHLPQNMDKLLLLRFLKVYDFDIEQSKELLILNLEMRKKNPNIFGKRDVLNDKFQQSFKTFQVCPLPKKTSENQQISIFRLLNKDPECYVYLDLCRTVVSMLDIRFVTPDDNDLTNGEIGVIDMTGFGIKHLLKSAKNLSMMRSYMRYVQEAAPFRIVQNHFINCPPMMDKFISLIKPFMKKEVMDTLQFHTSLESLYDYLPRESLPNEFGGTAGNIDDFYSDWMKIVESKREYLLNEENWKLADE